MVMKAAAQQNPIQDALNRFLCEYLNAKAKCSTATAESVQQFVRPLERSMWSCPSIHNNSFLQVEGSVGHGSWAIVPWLAVMDSRETATTQEGVYCVYLFRADMTGVYLAINQGVTQFTKDKRLTSTEARKMLRQNAMKLRDPFAVLAQKDFQLDNNMDLRSSAPRAVAYECGTVAYKFYAESKIPADSVLKADLSYILGAYDQYVSGKSAKC